MSEPKRIVHKRARAKVNLALAVDRALPDDHEFAGYHPIASWMAPIDLADELILTRLDEGSLSRYAIAWHPGASVQSPIDWPITKDLAVRAHLALQERAARELPVQVNLDKRIPVGGGLGGGSSDAASMLHGLRELFALDVTDAALDEIALSLGSDVPFFLRPGPCVVENLGERITEAASLEGWAALVIPGFGCATGAVYGAFDADPPDVFRAEDVRAMAEAGSAHGAALFNDLESPAASVEPRLGELLSAIRDGGASSFLVTGSGSTIFAVSEDEAGAIALADAARDAAASVGERAVCFAVPFSRPRGA